MVGWFLELVAKEAAAAEVLAVVFEEEQGCCICVFLVGLLLLSYSVDRVAVRQ